VQFIEDEEDGALKTSLPH